MDVRFDGIKLVYSYKNVLDGVSCEFKAGKIHALLGENGAGKSSLMKILAGAVKPTGGKIFLDGSEAEFKCPGDSLKRGIACVYQRPYLANSLTVKENLRIGVKTPKRKAFEQNGSNLLEAFGVSSVILNKKAGTLSEAERFFVAFASALFRKPKVLILDEPTAYLNGAESERFFEKLRSIVFSTIPMTSAISETLVDSTEFSGFSDFSASGSGVNVIVITHKENDLKFCDDATLIVEGKVCVENPHFPHSDSFGSIAPPQFPLSNSSRNFVDNFPLLRSRTSIGIIPSDRTYLASNPNLTVEQILYPAVKTCLKNSARKNKIFSHSHDKVKKSEKEIMFEIIKKANVNIRPDEKAKNLSGGMLQRLVLERELWNNPKTVVLENPYQGLDYASCRQLKARLEELQKNGVEIIECGSENFSHEKKWRRK